MGDMEKYKREIKKGIYRHFKGNLYEVVDLAYDSETLAPKVVYRALYGEGELWVRDASMWNEQVERDGMRLPRFEPVGELCVQPMSEDIK